MSATPHPIPPVLADRFAQSCSAFLASVSAAVTDAGQDPQQSTSPAFRAWKCRVLPLLQGQQTEVDQAAEAFRRGDSNPLLVSAEGKRGLAKDLDGYPLTFAGPEHAVTLDALETALVTAAWQLCSAAGIP